MASLMVIGGSGFFGKSILDAYQRNLLDPWDIDKVFVIARNASNLRKGHPNLLKGSISLLDFDIASCNTLPAADFVIHAANSTNALNYLQNPEAEKKNIQAGTYNYIKLAKQFHRNSKIVYCSSGAVYGQQPADLPYLTEGFSHASIDNIVQNKRDYAAAKQDAELAVQGLGGDGIAVSIARCFAFVGPYLPRDQHFAIGNFIEDGLNQRPIVVKAEHMAYRSYMHADDLVAWLMTIVAGAGKNCPIYNVGSNEAVELHDLASKVADFFDVPLSSAPISNLAYVDRYIPSVMKAEAELNLKLKINFDAALKLTVDRIRNSK